MLYSYVKQKEGGGGGFEKLVKTVENILKKKHNQGKNVTEAGVRSKRHVSGKGEGKANSYKYFFFLNGEGE